MDIREVNDLIQQAHADCSKCLELINTINKGKNSFLAAHNLKRHLATHPEPIKTEPIKQEIRSTRRFAMAVEVKRGGRTEFTCAECGKVIAAKEPHMRQGSKDGFKRYHKTCWDAKVAKAAEPEPKA